MKIFFLETKFTLILLFLISIFNFSCYRESVEIFDVLRFSIDSDPSSLDPIYSVDLTSQKINSLLFVKLFRFDKHGKIEGDLVKEYSLDGNILKLKLKSFDTLNQIQLNSDDVIYSLTRLKSEKGPRKSKYSFLKNFYKISEFELNLEFESNSPKYIELLTLAPASIYHKKSHQSDGSFKGAGIYSLDVWNKNDRLEMNLNLLNAKGFYPDKLILQVLNQPSSSIYLFRKGNIDLMKVPYFLLSHPVVKKSQKEVVKGRSIQYIAVNHTNPCFDLPFRLALNLAVDRELIIEKIFENSASKINSSVTDEYLEIYTKEKFYENYNLELAKQYLEKSKCYPEILKKPIELRMRSDDENKAKGAVLSQYFKNLGLTILILPMEKTKLYKENGEKKGDLTLLTWYIDYDSIYNFIDPLFASDSFGNGGNRSFYTNPKVEEFIRKTRINLDEKINPVEVVKILKEDSPWVFLWSIHENYVLSNKALKYPDLNHLFLK